MSQTVRLLATGSYLPETVLTNADLEKMVDTSDEWIVSRTGIRERRIMGENQENSDMCVAAARKAMDVAGLTAEDIDHIAVCTFTGDLQMPATACAVQKKLEARTVPSVDLSAACTGFLYGLSHGAGMILSGQARRVLVIASETLSRVTDYQDRTTCVLFGDGAGAAILSADEGGHRMGSFFLAADGSGIPPLKIPAGGSTRPPSVETVAERGHFIKMRGQEVFKFAVTKIISLIKDAADRCGIKPGNFDLVVPHQVNSRIIQAAVDRLDMHSEQFFCDMEYYGNTSGSSVAIALDGAIRGGHIKEGFRVLLLAFGGGFTWGSAVLEW